jgi:hypothetical protein
LVSGFGRFFVGLVVENLRFLAFMLSLVGRFFRVLVLGSVLVLVGRVEVLVFGAGVLGRSRLNGAVVSGLLICGALRFRAFSFQMDHRGVFRFPASGVGGVFIWFWRFLGLIAFFGHRAVCRGLVF